MQELLLVCADMFNGWGGATPRTFGVARGLLKHDWQTTTLTASSRIRWSSPAPEQAFPGRVIRTPFAELGQPAWMDRKGLRRMWRWSTALLSGADAAGPHGRWQWGSRAASWYAASPLFRTPRVVCGISCGDLRGMAAAHRLSARLAVPWLLEMRDPCPYPGYELDAAGQRTWATCLASCAHIVTTTQAMAKQLEANHPVCRGKVTPIYTGFEDTKPLETSSHREGTLELLHLGHLHGGAGRNARGLLRSMARLVAAEPRARDGLRLRLVGNGPGIEEAGRLARELSLDDLVEHVPFMSQVESLEAMRRADVLVAIKFPGPEHHVQIPGKVFHYLGQGKPILGIMGDGEAANILRRSGLAIIVGHDDVEGMAEQLLRWLRAPGGPERSIRPDKDYISSFSESAMAAHYHKLLIQLVPASS